MLRGSETLQSSQFLKNLVMDSQHSSHRSFKNLNPLGSSSGAGHYFECLNSNSRYLSGQHNMSTNFQHLNSLHNRVESEEEDDNLEVSTGLELSDYFTKANQSTNQNQELLKNMNIELSTKASTPPKIELQIPDQFD
jgi:hypothetical protein